MGISSEEYTPELKAELSLKMLRKEKTAEELEQEYGIYRERLRIWRRQLASRAYVIFEESNRHRNIDRVDIPVEDKPYLPRLKEIRRECGYSQKEVGQVLGIAQDAYAKYENGVIELPIKRLITLCGLFGVSSDYVLNLSETGGAENE